ncbi:zwei Ig domain protein zig-8-like [Penaeus japonicus]|uniref:zwei Ig domain protein zig-8-like n=2 Tax=Penaeus japonicus TaxID=27405 RepID=UPI001C70B159|nr:zwei Ig domain protein zig-8-like [Penaeus japonicus]
MGRRVATSLINLFTTLVLVLTSSVPPVTDTGQENVSHLTTERGVASTNGSDEPLRPIVYKDGPRVDPAHSGNVSSVLGKTASLRCRVLDRGNYTVSWIRHRDLHLLTVDQYTYTSDQRFQAMYESSTGDWILLVASVQLRDRGVYECQIGTTPPRSHFVSLHIIEPRTEILGGGDLHINTGSTINLTCLVLYHARSPHSLTWTHEGQEIHYDSARGGVSVLTEAGEVTRSALLIQKATREDAGNYTCQPKGAASATARVHVLHGEHRAAMHGGVGPGGAAPQVWLVVAAAVLMVWAARPPHRVEPQLPSLAPLPT